MGRPEATASGIAESRGQRQRRLECFSVFSIISENTCGEDNSGGVSLRLASFSSSSGKRQGKPWEGSYCLTSPHGQSLPWPDLGCVLTASSIPAPLGVLQEGEGLLSVEKDSVPGSQSLLRSQTSGCQMDGAGPGPQLRQAKPEQRTFSPGAH